MTRRTRKSIAARNSIATAKTLQQIINKSTNLLICDKIVREGGDLTGSPFTPIGPGGPGGPGMPGIPYEDNTTSYNRAERGLI